MWMFSRLWYVKYQDPAVFWILPSLVWVIYVIDRIRDSVDEQNQLRERHRFHWKHRKILIVLAALVTIASAVGFIFGVPVAMLVDWPRNFPTGHPNLSFFDYLRAFATALLSHGSVVLIFAAGFFVVARRPASAGKGEMDSVLFKNTLAAITFALGTAMGAHFYTFRSVGEMFFTFEVPAFALLCLMNINAIDLWEREERQGGDLAARDFLLTLPLLVLGFLSLMAAAFWHEYRKPFYYSMLLASAALLALDHYRAYLSARLLRVLADVAMLLPLPIFWYWFRN